MGKERFEVFGKIIKDNEDIPALLDNYLATVRLNEFNDKIKELEQELAELKEKAIVPKFKVGQKIWYLDRYGIQKDTIISFTYFSIQNEILYKMSDEIIDYREEYIFATEQEAQDKLKEMKGNE